MKNRPAVLWFILAAVLGAPSWATAGFTPIGPTDGWHNEPSLLARDTSGNGTLGILDYLYGLENLTRIDDTLDIYWRQPSPHGVIKAVAAFNANYIGIYVGVYDQAGTFRALFPMPTEWHGVEIADGYKTSGQATEGQWIDLVGPLRMGLCVDYDESYKTRYASSLASDNPTGVDEMVSFEITGNTGHPNNVVGNYVIGWEADSAWDRDYQDEVLELQGFEAAPEPSSLALAAGGFCAIAGVIAARRRKGRAN
ncbi:MAG: PEP-CTERM sorting domain-containing protein [Pirellulales bacterium]